jgi:hypothetical protein
MWGTTRNANVGVKIVIARFVAGTMMGRKRGSRFRKAIDAQKQFEQIEQKQREIREGKIPGVIDSIEKSKQREKNAHRRVRRPADAGTEYDVE